MAHRPRKRFGQHFLHDPGMLERIVTTIAPRPNERLVEIGPGLGALTTRLLETAGELDVIELDRDLVPELERRCHGLGTLRIHCVDALSFEYCALAEDGRTLRVVGNLPYNISTPLLFHLLETARCIQDMHFLLQREVVARLAAAPGGAEYGRLSVMVQYYCQVTPLFGVAPGAFRPPPKVDSQFVRLVPYKHPPVTVHAVTALERVTAQAFSQRRKTLRNALKGLLNEEEIRASGVDPGARPQTLTVAQFASLSNTLAGPEPRPEP